MRKGNGSSIRDIGYAVRYRDSSGEYRYLGRATGMRVLYRTRNGAQDYLDRWGRYLEMKVVKVEMRLEFTEVEESE